MNGFAAAERDGQRGAHVWPVGRAGLHVEPTRHIDRHDRYARGVHGREHLYGGGAQGATRRYADDPVDHQIGCLRHGLDEPTTGARERRERDPMDALRIEHHGGCGHPAPPQERGGPQRVTAVVSGPDHGADPPAGDRPGACPEFTGDRGGQAVGGTAHQHTIGQAGQQRRLGLANGIRGVVVAHRRQGYVVGRGLDGERFTWEYPPRSRLLRAVTHRLDVDAVGIEHERAVVVRLILGAELVGEQGSPADVMKASNGGAVPSHRTPEHVGADGTVVRATLDCKSKHLRSAYVYSCNTHGRWGRTG
jgi:hypothetical protein